MAPGYNVWFGLQHVTALGFRHSGRREQCRKCNPRATELALPGRSGADALDLVKCRKGFRRSLSRWMALPTQAHPHRWDET